MKRRVGEEGKREEELLEATATLDSLLLFSTHLQPTLPLPLFHPVLLAPAPVPSPSSSLNSPSHPLPSSSTPQTTKRATPEGMLPKRPQPGNPEWVGWIDELALKAEESGSKSAQSYKKVRRSHPLLCTRGGGAKGTARSGTRRDDKKENRVFERTTGTAERGRRERMTTTKSATKEAGCPVETIRQQRRSPFILSPLNSTSLPSPY